ncbi:MFS transporter [Tomitella fengzijianii]|uniref:MFS transporter n=1 Tax=Tomitella fengzijianii TaxID=2597660 RepID=A0A516X6J1_9ACTN|nr:MFS transporter [Tomitella fengzijianii]
MRVRRGRCGPGPAYAGAIVNTTGRRGSGSPGTSSPGPRRLGPSVAALCLGTVLNPLNSSMIAVALVDFQRHFALDIATVTWVITSFYLCSAAMQPVMGRFADRFGAKRLFITGMALVVVTCALATFAPSFALVCVARVFMALGTATAYPSAVAMVGALTARAQVSSTRPLGMIQMANTAGAAVGPVLGGVLVGVFGWPALFFVNVPLGLAAAAGVLWLTPADPPRERKPLRTIVIESDVPGIVLFTAMLVCALTAVLGAIPGATWWLAAGALVSMAAFGWRELRCPTPFLDLRMLGRNRPLILVYAAFAVFNGVYYCAFYGLPELLQQSGGYSPAVVGLLMLPLAAVSVVGTPFAARAIDRWGVRTVMLVGSASLVAAAGLLWLLTLSIAGAVVAVLLALTGIPYCIVSIAANQGMYASARPEDSGVAAGILQTSRYLGAISATAVIGVVFGPGATQEHWGVMVPVMVGLAVVTLALAAVWRPRERQA